jgi:hypothetical protein
MAFVASLVLLAVQLDQSGHEPLLDANQTILWFARLALVVMAIANVVTVERLVRTSGGVDGPRRSVGVVSPSHDRARALQAMRASFFVAIAIYGLLLFLLGGHLVDACAFAAASLAMLAWRFPWCWT